MQDALQAHYETFPGYKTRWLGMFFIGISLLVISLDNTILNVAIPSISRDLGASASELQWIIDSYVLVFAALLLTMGAMGDRFGRKIALQIGLVLFGIGSLAAALATTTDMLIAARAFTGIGGAIIMPATLSIISASFPPHERPQAFAIWAAIFGMGVGVGPVTGGLLLEYFEWNSVFYVNLPVVVIALIGGGIYLAESRDAHAPKLDLPGVVLSIIGLFALVYGIIHAGEEGWTDSTVLLSFAAAVVFLLGFAWWESRNPDAMLPLDFFRNMSFTIANTALALVTFSLFGSLFFMSQYWQSVLGFTPLESGIRLIPMALTLVIVSSSSARVAQRLGTKYVVSLGIFVASCGLFYLSRMLDVDTSYPTILLGLIIFGSGMGLTMSPATNSIMQAVPARKAGIGSAMNDTTRQLGGALGVAVLGTVMNHAYTDGVAGLHTAYSTLPAKDHKAIESSIQGAHEVARGLLSDASMPPEVAGPIAQAIHDTASQAFVNGINEAMLFGSIIMFATTLMALVLLPNQVRRSEEDVEEERRISGELPMSEIRGALGD